MKDVFINYRTGDGDEAAVLLERALSDRFGEERIFRAATSIPAGTSYQAALLEAVRNSRVLLAVVGSDWVRKSQLQDESDWVRREIIEAFKQGIKVIPILKGRTTERLRPTDLPSGLAQLADAQSLRLDMRDNVADLKRIGDELASLVPALGDADRLASRSPAPGFVRNSTGEVQGTVVQARDIAGDAGTVIKGNQGPVNTGEVKNSGDRMIYVAGAQTVNLGSLTAVRETTPRQQAADQLRWLAQRFADPAGLGEARQKLEKGRMVFLEARLGSGRTAAAKMLLWELRPDTDGFQELLPEGEKSRLNVEYIGNGDRVWLDLSARVDVWPDVHAELPSLCAAIVKRQAYLVTILPSQSQDLDSSFYQYHAKIARPPLDEVLRRYLRADDIPQPTSLSSLQFLHEGRPLREIARYARLIRDARNKQSGRGDFGDWCKAAGQALSNRDREVTSLVAELKQGPQRALLLATAMLHGAHADSIHDATALLLNAVKQPPDDQGDPQSRFRMSGAGGLLTALGSRMRPG